MRGENVTSGYYVDESQGSATAVAATDAEGWLHTGDIGERDADGRLFIKGRKKEMIVTPEGLNVFPEDVERVLNELPGRARVRGRRRGRATARSACTPCWCSSPAPTRTSIVRDANARLQDHQRIRVDVGVAERRCCRAPKARAS